jgi:hypothetical protein
VSAPHNGIEGARRAGFDWLSLFEPELESALDFHFGSSAARGSLEKTSNGFALRLDLRFNMAGGLPALDVALCSDDGWMIATAALGRSAKKLTPMRLLEVSTGLPGGVKVGCVVAASGHPLPTLRSEVPLDVGADLTVVVGEVLDGFAEGVRRIEACSGHPGGSENGAGALRAATPVSQTKHDTAAAARALADEGWTTATRDDGRVFVDLDVSDGYRQGLLESGVDGHLRFSSELPAPSEEAASRCAEALAISALLTNGWVRMVRAVYDGAFRLEVPLGPGLGSRAVPRAAAALSIAQRVLGDEAEILTRDPVVASHYVRIGARPRKRSSRVRKRRKGQSRTVALAGTATTD